jgi:hypothetical protein
MAARSPIRRGDLLAAIGVGNKQIRFARWAQPLLDAGLLEMIYPDARTSPKQRYLITDRGKDVLARPNEPA